MLLNEPPPTQGDLHFDLGRIPVRVHPFFWLAGLLTGLSATEGEPKQTFLWIAILFVSILIHELGHALLQRKYGARPRIVLHGFGGLAIADSQPRGPVEQVLISLAGPGAGFLFAALILGSIAAAGLNVAFIPAWSDAGGMSGWSMNLVVGRLWYGSMANELTAHAIGMLLSINLLWGLINLLPIYPLDGGQVSRELFTLGRSPREGIIRSLWLSIVCSVAAAIGLTILFKSLLAALLFGYLAYTNYRTLEAYTGRGPSQPWR